MGCLVRSIIGLFLLPAALGVIYAGAGFIAENAAELVRSPFTWGFALMFLPAAALASRAPLSEVLEHEFGHYVTAKLFGHEVVSVQGHRNDPRPEAEMSDGGLTVRSPGIAGYALITLAPYFLPLLTLPLLLVRPFMFPFVQPIIDFLIGATLVWHFVTVFTELWQGQPDITDATVLLSAPVILIANMLLAVFIMVVVLEAWDALLPFAQEAWTASVAAYRAAIAWLAQMMRNLVDIVAQWV